MTGTVLERMASVRLSALAGLANNKQRISKNPRKCVIQWNSNFTQSVLLTKLTNHPFARKCGAELASRQRRT